MTKKQRKIDKRKLNSTLEKLKTINGIKSDSMYVKPFAEDVEFIKEISRETGDSYSTNAAKLIHLGIAALTAERKQKSAQQGTLEHIYKLAEYNLKTSEENSKAAAASQLALARLESRMILLEQTSGLAAKLTAEIYCMVNMAVSYVNIFFGKVLMMLSTDTAERNAAFDIATTQMIELGETSLRDVRSFFRHHNEFEAENQIENAYLSSKIERLKARVNADG